LIAKKRRKTTKAAKKTKRRHPPNPRETGTAFFRFPIGMPGRHRRPCGSATNARTVLGSVSIRRFDAYIARNCWYDSTPLFQLAGPSDQKPFPLYQTLR